MSDNINEIVVDKIRLESAGPMIVTNNILNEAKQHLSEMLNRLEKDEGLVVTFAIKKGSELKTISERVAKKLKAIDDEAEASLKSAVAKAQKKPSKDKHVAKGKADKKPAPDAQADDPLKDVANG